MTTDPLTMHLAHTRKPAPGASFWVTTTLGLAVAMMALPAAGQGTAPAASPSSFSSSPASVALASNSNNVTPVIVGSDVAAAATRHESALVPRADAEEALAAVAELAEPGAPYYATVGDATRSLLAWQRSGQIASPVPRPVHGEIAQRSRERYLKSFEREIPERFQSSVSQKSNSR